MSDAGAVLTVVIILLAGCVAAGVVVDQWERVEDRRARRWDLEDEHRRLLREIRRRDADDQVRWRS